VAVSFIGGELIRKNCGTYNMLFITLYNFAYPYIFYINFVFLLLPCIGLF